MRGVWLMNCSLSLTSFGSVAMPGFVEAPRWEHLDTTTSGEMSGGAPASGTAALVRDVQRRSAGGRRSGGSVKTCPPRGEQPFPLPLGGEGGRRPGEGEVHGEEILNIEPSDI